MIGLISDTHGLLREEVVYNLSNCNLIIHTGDIGKFEVIENLEKIAKVEFIRGNCDKDKNIAKEDKIIDVYNIRIYLVHDISKVSIDLKEENIDIVVNKLRSEFGLNIPEEYVGFVKKIDMFQFSWDIVKVGNKEIELNHFLGYDPEISSRDLYEWYLFVSDEREEYLTFAMGFGNEEIAIKAKGDNLGIIVLISPDKDDKIVIQKLCNNFNEFEKKLTKE